jgi:hypothetical protein
LLSESPGVEACHRLHYLQMACEKIAKAFRFRDTTTPESRLTTEHVAFSQFIENYLKSPDIRRRYHQRAEQLREVTKIARALAREIEKLAPAVARDTSPANTEYPWADGDHIVVPCEFAYSNLTLLTTPGGRTFMRLIAAAIHDFDQIRMR